MRRSRLAPAAKPRVLSVREAAALLSLAPGKARSVAELKAAFRRQALQWHPDLNDSPAAKQRFQDLNDALGVCMAAARDDPAAIRGRAEAASSAAASEEDWATHASDVDALHARASAVLARARVSSVTEAVLRAGEAESVGDRSVERIALACRSQHVASIQAGRIADSLPDDLCGAPAFEVAVDRDADQFAAAGALSLLSHAAPRIVKRLNDALPRQLAAVQLTKDDVAAFRPCVLTGALGIRVLDHSARPLPDGDDMEAEWSAAGLPPTTTCPELRCIISVAAPDASEKASAASDARRGHRSMASTTNLQARRGAVEAENALLKAVTPALQRWQAASVRRVAAERRVARAVRQLSERLGLVRSSAQALGEARRRHESGDEFGARAVTPVRLPLEVHPDLTLPNAAVERLAEQLEQSAIAAHTNARADIGGLLRNASLRRAAEIAAGAPQPARDGEDPFDDLDDAGADQVENLPPMDLTAHVASIRLVAARASLLKGTSAAKADSAVTDTTKTETVEDGAEDGDTRAEGVNGDGGDANQPTEFRIRRAPTACRAEEVSYVIEVLYDPSWPVLRRRIATAVAAVHRRAHAAISGVPKVSLARDGLERPKAAGAAPTSAQPRGAAFDDDPFGTLKPVRRRADEGAAMDVAGNMLVPDAADPHAATPGPVRCFARLFGVDTGHEAAFWAHVERHRVALAQQQPVLGTMNVRLLGSTGEPAAAPKDNDPLADEPPPADACGWVGTTPDGDQEVTVSEAVLADDATFDGWIDEVVTQCCLSREVDTLLRRHRIRNVVRDPEVPLAQFLSFCHRYRDSAARGVIEHIGQRSGRAPATIAVVPHYRRFDVLPSGALAVPWNADLALLIAFVGGTPDPAVAIGASDS